MDAEWSPGTLPGLHLHSCSETKREVIDLCFPWWQFQEEGELPHLLKRVEKYPRACVRWLWGTRAFVLVYDPDYMKMVLGRSGERETLSWKHLPFEYRPLGVKFQKTQAHQMPRPEFLQTPTQPKPERTTLFTVIKCFTPGGAGFSFTSLLFTNKLRWSQTWSQFPVHTVLGWAPFTVASPGSWDGQTTTDYRIITDSVSFYGTEQSLCFRAIHHLSPVGVLLHNTESTFLGPRWLSGQRESGVGGKWVVASEWLPFEKHQEGKGAQGLDLRCSRGCLHVWSHPSSLLTFQTQNLQLPTDS